MGERTMSEHALGKIERFQLLLQQLQLIEDAVVVHFNNAQIERLLVEKKARKWHFQFLFENILPYNVYVLFTTQLERTFSNIATVSYHINVTNQTISPELIRDYWSYSIQQIDGIAPPLLKLLNEQFPDVNGNKLTISVRNDTEGQALKRKYGETITKIFQSLGFPSLSIETELKNDEK
jgi:DNA polymerase-3 subunit alpha (Gram-positive type)